MSTPTGNSIHQFDPNNKCVGCGTDIAGLCPSTCPFETGAYGPAVLLRAAADRLPEHSAGVGYDISGALFSAALELVGEHQAASAADAAKQVLTNFLVDQWGPGAQEIRAEVVYRHGLFAHLPEIAQSLYAAAAQDDGIDFDADAFGEFPTSSTIGNSPFAVPTQVDAAGPDEECPVWRWEAPQGRYALLIGDPDDGGRGHCGTLAELEAFVVQQQAALRAAQRRQQAASDTPTTPPGLNLNVSKVLQELRGWAQAQLTGSSSALDNPGAAQAFLMLDRELSRGRPLPLGWVGDPDPASIDTSRVPGPDATSAPPPQTDAVVTSRVVTIYDLTARQRAELANELGVDRSVRRLPRARDASGVVVAGVKLDSRYGYDIEAAVAYAQRAGLRYVEVRETTFESGPTATA